MREGAKLLTFVMLAGAVSEMCAGLTPHTVSDLRAYDLRDMACGMSAHYYEKSADTLSYHGGEITLTLQVPRVYRDHDRTLRFRITWGYYNLSIPVLVANPSLQLTLSTRLPGDKQSSTKVQLPVIQGGFGVHGAILGRGFAASWSGALSMDTPTMLLFDALRHHEGGLWLGFEIHADLVPLSVPEGVPLGLAHLPTTSRLTDRMPVSNEVWREIGAFLGWPRPQVFELDPRSFADISEFSAATQHLQNAERQLFLGHWAASIGESRRVVEAVLKHLGYKGDHNIQWNLIQQAGLPAEMYDVFKAVFRLTSREHHADMAPSSWTRADARFMLTLAASLAEYAGSLPARTPPS